MTSIPEFYAGRSVLVTGATGFMGKVLIEKLLRSCPAIKTVYLLVRPKKGQQPSDRVQQLFSSKLFEKVRQEQPDFEDKVVPIEGDITQPGLGISQTDHTTLLTEVSIIFHSAATVKFDEVLKLSVQMNVVGLGKMLDLAREMPKLEAFIHVSTAYANCDRTRIAEAIYPPPLHPKKMIDALEWMEDDVVDALTPKLIKPRPNTYTFSKSLAEWLFLEQRGQIPCAIVRPSIVGSSWQEPFPGWVDNFNGPTGLLAAIGKGLLRIMHGNFHGTADIIPVDIATNLMIAVAWYTALQRPDNIEVYNCTTGQLNKLTWGLVERSSCKCFMHSPLDSVPRVPDPHFTTSRIWRDLNIWFDHYLPSWLMDLCLTAVGKKAFLVKIQNRLWKSVHCLEFFTFNQWVFSNSNTMSLLEKLRPEDRKTFNFDVRHIHWPTYMENYCLGTKKFALKEDVSKLPEARRHMQMLVYGNRIFNIIMVIVLLRLLMLRSAAARSVWYLMLAQVSKLVKRIPGLSKS